MKFSKNKRKSIRIIVDCKICCGCGACTVICPASCIEFIYGERYNYPKIDTESCINCGKCLEVCPSAFLLKGTDPGFLDEPGRSLVLVRTECGRRILHGAIDAGYLKLERAEPEVLPASQQALLNRRSNLFGRLLTLQMMCVPVPWYTGFRLFRNWLELPATKKLRSIGGTLKRIVLRGWMKPLKPMVLDNRTPETKLCA